MESSRLGLFRLFHHFLHETISLLFGTNFLEIPKPQKWEIPSVSEKSWPLTEPYSYSTEIPNTLPVTLWPLTLT